MADNELRITSDQFFVDEHDDINFEKLLKKKSIEQIIDLECDLKHDIKILESQMKNLVYENYNKLLQTSEIIQNMTNEFIDTQKNLSNVQTCLINGFEQSISLMTALKPSQEKLTKTQVDRSNCFLLQLIFSLPQKIQKNLDSENFIELSNLYNTTKYIINKLAHHDSIATINKEINKIIFKTKQCLYQKIRDQFFHRLHDKKSIDQLIDSLLLLDDSYDNIDNIIQQTIIEKIELHAHIPLKSRLTTENVTCYVSALSEIHEIIYTFTQFSSNDRNISDSVFNELFKFATTFNDNLNLLDLNLKNIDINLDLCGKVYILLNQLNPLVCNQLASIIIEFSCKLKKIILSKAVNFSIAKSLSIIEIKKNDFLSLVVSNNISTQILYTVKSINESLITSLKKIIQTMMTFFLSLNGPDKIENKLFYQIFDHLFIISVYSDYFCEYFRTICSKLYNLLCQYDIHHDPEILLYISLVLDEIGDDMVSDLFTQFHYNEIQTSKKLRNELINLFHFNSQIFMTNYIQRFTDIHFVSLIFKIMRSVKESSTSNFDVIPPYFIKMNRIINILSIFKQLNFVFNPQNNITFLFVSSIEVFEYGLFEHDQNRIKIYEENINCTTNSIITAMYKIIGKSLLECFNAGLYSIEQIIEIQKKFYLIKKLFSSYENMNKKVEIFEKQFLFSLKYHGCSQSQLLSLYELEELSFQVN